MKEYKNALKDHLKKVKEIEFPSSGVITLTYDIESGSLVSSIDKSISTRDADEGGNGDPFP